MTTLPNIADVAAQITAAPDRVAAGDIYLAARSQFRAAGQGVPAALIDAMRAWYFQDIPKLEPVRR